MLVIVLVVLVVALGLRLLLVFIGYWSWLGLVVWLVWICAYFVVCYYCCDLQGLDIVVVGSGAALLDFGVWFLIAVFMVAIVV